MNKFTLDKLEPQTEYPYLASERMLVFWYLKVTQSQLEREIREIHKDSISSVYLIWVISNMTLCLHFINSFIKSWL